MNALKYKKSRIQHVHIKLHGNQILPYFFIIKYKIQEPYILEPSITD